MRQCMDAENLHRRMKKLMGQLQAIDQMIDKDVPCEDILIQINAVKGALHRVGQIVLEGHLQHCVRDAFERASERDSRLAAVFITENGKLDEPLMGMLTPWDVLGEKGSAEERD